EPHRAGVDPQMVAPGVDGDVDLLGQRVLEFERDEAGIPTQDRGEVLGQGEQPLGPAVVDAIAGTLVAIGGIGGVPVQVEPLCGLRLRDDRRGRGQRLVVVVAGGTLGAQGERRCADAQQEERRATNEDAQGAEGTAATRGATTPARDAGGRRGPGRGARNRRSWHGENMPGPGGRPVAAGRREARCAYPRRAAPSWSTRARSVYDIFCQGGVKSLRDGGVGPCARVSSEAVSLAGRRWRGARAVLAQGPSLVYDKGHYQ